MGSAESGLSWLTRGWTRCQLQQFSIPVGVAPRGVPAGECPRRETAAWEPVRHEAWRGLQKFRQFKGYNVPLSMVQAVEGRWFGQAPGNRHNIS